LPLQIWRVKKREPNTGIVSVIEVNKAMSPVFEKNKISSLFTVNDNNALRYINII
jgi:hypothetical protein